MDQPLDDALRPLRAPIPPGLADTFGYPGAARFVGFLWEPAGDEVVFTDGLMFGTGDGHAFLAFCRHGSVMPQLGPYHLGSSDAEAEHCLVLDRAQSRAWGAEKNAAKAFLERQHPLLSAEQTLHAEQDAPRAAGDLRSNGWQEVRVDPDAVRAALDRQRRAVARMLAFLDRHA